MEIKHAGTVEKIEIEIETKVTKASPEQVEIEMENKYHSKKFEARVPD